jgi:hypothetical protein
MRRAELSFWKKTWVMFATGVQPMGTSPYRNPRSAQVGATLVVQDSGVHAVGAAQPVQTGRPGPDELRGLGWHGACL